MKLPFLCNYSLHISFLFFCYVEDKALLWSVFFFSLSFEYRQLSYQSSSSPLFVLLYTRSLFLMSRLHPPLSPVMLVSGPFSYIRCYAIFPQFPGSSCLSFSLYLHSQCSFLVTFSVTRHDVHVPSKSYLLSVLRNHLHCTSDPCFADSVFLCLATSFFLFFIHLFVFFTF